MKETVSCIIICLAIFAGCQKEFNNDDALKNIQSSPSQPIPYQVTINRTTVIETKNDSDKNNLQRMTEELAANLSLWPVNSIQDRLVFKVVCNSVQILRSDFVGTITSVEALRYLEGKELTLTISPQGDILDDSSIENLMKLAVKESVTKNCKGTFKDPDMLVDFYNVVTDLCVIVAQESYSKGQTFVRQVSTPTPAVEFSLPQRQITSTVDQLVHQEGIKKAKITEVHAIVGDAETKLFDIYPELIKTKGLFSSLRRWRTQSIDGTGEIMVNLETGFPESFTQHWQVKATASHAIPIKGVFPAITIHENVTVKHHSCQASVGQSEKR